MRKLVLQEFYKHEPKNGAFRIRVLQKFRAIFPSDDPDNDAKFIPWARIYADLRRHPGFEVETKDAWEEIRKNATIKKLRDGGGAGKRHFMSLWFWLYTDHDDPEENRILNAAANELIEVILGIPKDTTETLERLHRKKYGPSSSGAKKQISGPSADILLQDYASDEMPKPSGSKDAAADVVQKGENRSLKRGRAGRRKKGRDFLARRIMEKYEEGPDFKFPFVMLLDIDDLTIINKVHGWEVGSEILDVFEDKIQIACSTFLFEREYVCGICGDDTFFMVLYTRDIDDCDIVCEEFARSIQEYDWCELSDNLRVTFSAGWSQRVEFESDASCSQRAEDGMNAAKQNKGENTWFAGPPFENFALRGGGFGWS